MQRRPCRPSRSSCRAPQRTHPITKPVETTATAPAAPVTPAEAPKSDTAATTPAAPPAVTAPATATAPAATTAPAAEPVKAASTVPAADQPVADKLREQLAAKSLRYFDRKGERQAVEKFYAAREYAPMWTASGSLTASAKGVIARLKDAASEGLNVRPTIRCRILPPRPRRMRWPRPN